MSAAYDKDRLCILDLSNMNVVFISNWFYRYTNEMDRLRRNVVCARNGLNGDQMIPTISSSNKKFTLFN